MCKKRELELNGLSSTVRYDNNNYYHRLFISKSEALEMESDGGRDTAVIKRYIQRIMVEGIPGGNNYSKALQDHPFFSNLLKVGGEFGIDDEGTVLLLPAEAGVSVGTWPYSIVILSQKTCSPLTTTSFSAT